MPEHNLEVLVVDDEVRLADLFATWLRSEASSVHTVYDGESALERIDESVDVVLLDRRMPGLSGDEVLETVRERGIDCHVIMVTAVDPDFDIIDLEFDDYLVKPVSKTDVEDAIEAACERDEYDEEIQEYFDHAQKKAVLESRMATNELENSDEYEELVHRVDELAASVDEEIASLSSHEEFASAFQEIVDGDGN